jgi:hypothetical protein
MRRDQKPSAGINVKGSAVNPTRIDMLDRARFAAHGVDRKHGERVLAAGKDAFGSLTDRARCAVRDIDKTAVRVDMNGAGDLPPAAPVGIA